MQLILIWMVQWIIIQFISFNGTDLNSGGVAYAAHIGGFISGAFLINIMKNKITKKNKTLNGSVPSSK